MNLRILAELVADKRTASRDNLNRSIRYAGLDQQSGQELDKAIFFGEPLKEAVQACNDVLGEWIARFPEQWMWLYPRWKSTVGD